MKEQLFRLKNQRGPKMQKPTLAQKSARNWHEVLKAYLERLRAEKSAVQPQKRKALPLEAEIFY